MSARRPIHAGARRVAARLRHPAVAAVLFAVALVLVARPLAVADSDALSNVAPTSQLPAGSLANAYPLGNYALDHHFDAVDAGVFSGVDVSGIAPTIAWFLAQTIWMLTAFLADALILLFTFAFSLDLVNGSSTTGGAGALAPIAAAVRTIYRDVFGHAWLVVGVLLTGMWAIWNALVRRRYTETAGALGLSLVFVTIALAFVTRPEIIGQASRWTNQMSSAFLALSTNGDLSSPQRAKQANADQLFSVLVFQPWTVLNFGGLEHCVVGEDRRSVPVRPLSRDPARDAVLARRLAAGTQIQADGKTCVNHRTKYAAHFLRFSPESDERDAEHDALKDGDSGKLPDADPGKADGSYTLGEIDKPAADAMGKGGQYQRLLLATVIFVGQLGAFLLLGALSVVVIVAQVLVLLLLAFAPVALVVGVFPGRGHDFFKAWLARLATYLLRKAIYSLLLAILLAVAAALADATASLGWLMAFGLQAVFYWTVLLNRNKLAGELGRATVGHAGPVPDGAGRITAATYAAASLTGRALTTRRPPASSSGTDPAAAPQPPKPHEQKPVGSRERDRDSDPASSSARSRTITHTDDRRSPEAEAASAPPAARPGEHAATAPEDPPTRREGEVPDPERRGPEVARQPGRDAAGEHGSRDGSHDLSLRDTTPGATPTAPEVPEKDSHAAPDLPAPIRPTVGPHTRDRAATAPVSRAPDLPDPVEPHLDLVAPGDGIEHDALDEAAPGTRDVAAESPLRGGLVEDARRLQDRPADPAEPVPDTDERDAGAPRPRPGEETGR